MVCHWLHIIYCWVKIYHSLHFKYTVQTRFVIDLTLHFSCSCIQNICWPYILQMYKLYVSVLSRKMFKLGHCWSNCTNFLSVKNMIAVCMSALNTPSRLKRWKQFSFVLIRNKDLNNFDILFIIYISGQIWLGSSTSFMPDE